MRCANGWFRVPFTPISAAIEAAELADGLKRRASVVSHLENVA